MSHDISVSRLKDLLSRCSPGRWEFVVTGDCVGRRIVVDLGTSHGWTTKELPDADAELLVLAKSMAIKIVADSYGGVELCEPLRYLAIPQTLPVELL